MHGKEDTYLGHMQLWTSQTIRGASVSRAHLGLDSLAAMGLQGTWSSRAHPALDSPDGMGIWVRIGGTGGSIAQKDMPTLGVHLFKEPPRQ